MRFSEEHWSLRNYLTYICHPLSETKDTPWFLEENHWLERSKHFWKVRMIQSQSTAPLRTLKHSLTVRAFWVCQLVCLVGAKLTCSIIKDSKQLTKLEGTPRDCQLWKGDGKDSESILHFTNIWGPCFYKITGQDPGLNFASPVLQLFILVMYFYRLSQVLSQYNPVNYVHVELWKK